MWIVFVVLILGGGVCTAVGWYGFVGKLPPNWIAGIRTPYTMKSPENWYAVHRAGGPYVIFGGVACTAAGLAFLPFAIAGQVPDALAAGVAIASAVVLGGSVIASWLVGTRARPHPPAPSPGLAAEGENVRRNVSGGEPDDGAAGP